MIFCKSLIGINDAVPLNSLFIPYGLCIIQKEKYVLTLLYLHYFTSISITNMGMSTFQHMKLDVKKPM